MQPLEYVLDLLWYQSHLSQEREDTDISPFLYGVLFIKWISYLDKYVVKIFCLPCINVEVSWDLHNFFFFFLFFFFKNVSRSSSVNYAGLMLCFPSMVTFVYLSVIWSWFSIKLMIEIFIFFSLRDIFYFDLKVFFFPLISFIVCHTNCDCLSTEFIILLIWPSTCFCCNCVDVFCVPAHWYLLGLFYDVKMLFYIIQFFFYFIRHLRNSIFLSLLGSTRQLLLSEQEQNFHNYFLTHVFLFKWFKLASYCYWIVVSYVTIAKERLVIS